MADHGPDCDRTKDRLGASDMAVVEFRKQMVEAVRDFQAGKSAIGTGDQAIPKNVCSFQGVVPKTTDWREYETTYVWADGMDRSEFESSYNVKA